MKSMLSLLASKNTVEQLQRFCENANDGARLAKSTAQGNILEIEKLKVNANAQINMVNEKIDSLNDIKRQVDMNAVKSSHLENRIEQAFLNGMLKRPIYLDKSHGIKSNNTSSLVNGDERLLSNCTDLILQLNNSLISRIDDLALEVQYVRERAERIANSLRNISTISRNQIIGPSSENDLEQEQSNHGSERNLVSWDMKAEVDNILESLDKLRFSLRGRYIGFDFL